jgi:hypothetical protein
MARRYDDGDIAGGLIGGVVLAAVLLAVVFGMLLVAMLTELWRINTNAAMTPDTRRYLWGALAGFLGALLLAGLLSALTYDGGVGLFVAALGFFLYVLACEFIDWLARRDEVPVVVPATLSVEEVVNWNTPSAAATELPSRGERSRAA